MSGIKAAAHAKALPNEAHSDVLLIGRAPNQYPYQAIKKWYKNPRISAISGATMSREILTPVRQNYCLSFSFVPLPDAPLFVGQLTFGRDERPLVLVWAELPAVLGELAAPLFAELELGDGLWRSPV